MPAQACAGHTAVYLTAHRRGVHRRPGAVPRRARASGTLAVGAAPGGLPLVARTVAGASVLAFGLCFDESGTAYYLKPARPGDLPTRIWLAPASRPRRASAAVSTLVIGLAIALMGCRLRQRNAERQMSTNVRIER